MTKKHGRGSNQGGKQHTTQPPGLVPHGDPMTQYVPQYGGMPPVPQGTGVQHPVNGGYPVQTYQPNPPPPVQGTWQAPRVSQDVRLQQPTGGQPYHYPPGQGLPHRAGPPAFATHPQLPPHMVGCTCPACPAGAQHQQPTGAPSFTPRPRKGRGSQHQQHTGAPPLTPGPHNGPGSHYQQPTGAGPVTAGSRKGRGSHHQQPTGAPPFTPGPQNGPGFQPGYPTHPPHDMRGPRGPPGRPLPGNPAHVHPHMAPYPGLQPGNPMHLHPQMGPVQGPPAHGYYPHMGPHPGLPPGNPAYVVPQGSWMPGHAYVQPVPQPGPAQGGGQMVLQPLATSGSTVGGGTGVPGGLEECLRGMFPELPAALLSMLLTMVTLAHRHSPLRQTSVDAAMPDMVKQLARSGGTAISRAPLEQLQGWLAQAEADLRDPAGPLGTAAFLQKVLEDFSVMKRERRPLPDMPSFKLQPAFQRIGVSSADLESAVSAIVKKPSLARLPAAAR